MTKTMTAPDPIDIHVGNRLRLCRLWVGMGLVELGNRIGVSHQQIQKYETGQTRIGASRLFDLSQALDVPVGYYFDGISSSDTPAKSGLAELESSGFLHEVLSTTGGFALNRAFIEIKDKKVRRSVINLIQALGD